MRTKVDEAAGRDGAALQVREKYNDINQRHRRPKKANSFVNSFTIDVIVNRGG